MTKHLNTQSLLWLALVLAMTGSLKHLTAVFASVDGDYLFGLIQAVAVDAGLFALAYSIRQRKATSKPTWFVWCGVALFSLISVFGNYIYGQTALGGQLPGWIVWLKPIVLAASLPVLVIYLSEIVSDNREHKPHTKPQNNPSKPQNVGLDTTKAVATKQAKTNTRKQRAQQLRSEGMTQQAIADELEVSVETVRRYTNGVAK